MGYVAGEYLFKVTGQGFGENKSGSSFFFLEGEPVAIYQNGEEYSVTTGKRTIRLTITEKNVQYVIDKLTAIGWTGGKWSSLDPSSQNHHSFVDSEIRAKCELRPSQDDPDKVFENWDLPFIGAATESDPSIARRLDQVFGKSAAAAKKPAARKPAAPKPQAVAVGDGSDTDDGVPF